MAHVTTFIPVYNGGRYLRYTLESLAKQTRRPDRVIVQDNCSTDDTRKVFEDFESLGFEWRQNPTNLGAVGNFNKVLDFASETEYLHILPADDLIKPDFFERLLPTLADVDGRALVHCHYEIIDAEGRLAGKDSDITCHFKQGPDRSDRIIPVPRFLRDQRDLKTVFCPAVILKTNYLPPPVKLRNLPQAADCVFYAEWGVHCKKIVEVPEILCQYRRHAGCTTYQNLKDPEAYVREEWLAMQTIAGLLDEKGFDRWIQQQRLKCLLAARNQVKNSAASRENIELSRRAARSISGPLHWFLAGCVVKLRDVCRGSKIP